MIKQSAFWCTLTTGDVKKELKQSKWLKETDKQISWCVIWHMNCDSFLNLWACGWQEKSFFRISLAPGFYQLLLWVMRRLSKRDQSDAKVWFWWNLFHYSWNINTMSHLCYLDWNTNMPPVVHANTHSAADCCLVDSLHFHRLHKSRKGNVMKNLILVVLGGQGRSIILEQTPISPDSSGSASSEADGVCLRANSSPGHQIRHISFCLLQISAYLFMRFLLQ